jgi:hypothetical protein
VVVSLLCVHAVGAGGRIDILGAFGCDFAESIESRLADLTIGLNVIGGLEVANGLFCSGAKVSIDSGAETCRVQQTLSIDNGSTIVAVLEDSATGDTVAKSIVFGAGSHLGTFEGTHGVATKQAVVGQTCIALKGFDCVFGGVTVLAGAFNTMSQLGQAILKFRDRSAGMTGFQRDTTTEIFESGSRGSRRNVTSFGHSS